MKRLCLLLIMCGCSLDWGSLEPTDAATVYVREECMDVNISCYYEQGWDRYDASATTCMGEMYQCNAPITLIDNRCFQGNTYGNITLWCCVPRL